MPWDIKQNFGSCNGYAVVKRGTTEIEGCHSSRSAAQRQMAALYASEAEKEIITSDRVPNRGPDWIGRKKRVKKDSDLYTMLTEEEKAFHDALVSIAQTFGPFDQGSSSIWVGYKSASENEDKEIGVKCSNCSFFIPESNGCMLLSYQVEPEAICRLAAIPDGLVKMSREEEEEFVDEMMENMDKMSVSDIDLKPTESMANNARRGLEMRREHGRGGTEVGVARARDLANRKNLSPETVGRMYSYFSRHEVDKKGKGWSPGSEGYPSNGRIAWLLWGGDSGYSWAKSKWSQIQRARMNKEQDEAEKKLTEAFLSNMPREARRPGKNYTEVFFRALTEEEK